MSQVRCRYCRRTYDLGKVEVYARYADCSMYKAPCCGRDIDDGPGRGPHYKPVGSEGEALLFIDENGVRHYGLL